MTERIKIYSTKSCPRCTRSKKLMDKWEVKYEEVMVDNSPEGLREMLKRTNNVRTVPQIFLGDEWIGGLDELTEAHMDGKLDNL